LPVQPSGRRRVLLVDDDQRLLTVLTDVLRSGGHQVTTAGDGEEALEMFDPEQHDVVITDLGMAARERLASGRAGEAARAGHARCSCSPAGAKASPPGGQQVRGPGAGQAHFRRRHPRAPRGLAAGASPE
jgi:hypothetical protein